MNNKGKKEKKSTIQGFAAIVTIFGLPISLVTYCKFLDRPPDEWLPDIRSQHVEGVVYGKDGEVRPFLSWENDTDKIRITFGLEVGKARPSFVNLNYPAGKYMVDDAEYGREAMDTVRKIINEVESKYPGKDVGIICEISANANSQDFQKGAKYDMELGPINEVTYYEEEQNEEVSMTITRFQELTPDKVAFLRAHSIYKQLRDDDHLQSSKFRRRIKTGESQTQHVMIRIIIERPKPKGFFSSLLE